MDFPVKVQILPPNANDLFDISNVVDVLGWWVDDDGNIILRIEASTMCHCEFSPRPHSPTAHT